MSRTNKKPYTKSKAFDKSCRNHGTCGWCQGNRHHKNNKKPSLKEALKEIYQQ